MSDAAEDSDPLMLAIQELREEFMLWVDAELARLHELMERPARSVDVPGATTSPFRDVSGRVASSTLDEPRSRPSETYRPRESPIERELPTRPLRPLAASSELPARDESQPIGSDPRQRLEALARMLDSRLKQAQGGIDGKGAH